MKKLLFLVCGLFILNSCATDNENRGIKEVLRFYGGHCKSSIGISSSTDNERKKYFELELSKSEAIEKQSREIPEMPSSNIAYLFFKNLNEREKQNYDQIHSVLILSGGRKLTYKYSISLLQTISNRIKLADKVVSLIKQKDFDTLQLMLDSTYIKYNKQDIIEGIKSAEAHFENISAGFQLQGFKISPLKDGTTILHILGVIIREKEGNQFRIDVDLNSDKDKVILLEYTWQIKSKANENRRLPT